MLAVYEFYQYSVLLNFYQYFSETLSQYFLILLIFC